LTEGNDVGGQEEQEPVAIDNNKSNGQSSKKNDPYDFEENRNKPKKGPGAPKGPRAPKNLPKLTIITRRASGSDRENEQSNQSNDYKKIEKKNVINNDLNQPRTSNNKPAMPKKSILQRQNSTTRTSSYIIKDSNNQQTHNKYDP
jgi:hypothetical protein